MLICIGYYPGDLDQAQRLAGWLKEIGPFPGHRLLVARDIRTDEQPFADVGFDRVDEIVVPDDVWNSWPQSANNVFRKIAVHVELVDKAPYWLWIEPDCVPFDQEAFDTLQADHEASGCLFTGDKVVVAEVPVHMSGVGIYPGEMSRHAGNAKICMDLAWDMAAKDQIVPAMHVSPYILHAWKRDENQIEHDPGFADWDAVEREIFAFKPQCVLFHASKKGSLINLLRERRNPPAITGPKEGDWIVVQRAPRAQILIKSYPVDYPLLKYCLESVAKFAKGFCKPAILVVPDDHIPQEATGYETFIQMRPVKEEGSGYLFQQSVKANAHRLSDADYIMHIDSDTVLTTEVRPEDFFREGKPIWFVTPYTDTHSPWKAATEKFIGHPIELEFMRRLPMFIPRAIHEKAAAFCQEKHGINLHRYIMSSDHFSEFNALGAIAWDFFQDQIHWYNTSEHPQNEWPDLVALQTWSHAPFAENQQKFEAILNGENLSGAEIERSASTDPVPSVASLGDGQGEPAAPATHSAETLNISARSIIPWANQAETEAEIKRLCRELRRFQDAPRHIDRVRKELMCFQVITGDKKIKGLIKRRHRLGPKYDPMKPETLTKKQKSSIANIDKGRRLRLELLKQQ